MITSNKITILIKNLNPGGAQKVCLTLCNELIKRNHPVELWILDYEDNSLTRQLDENIKLIDLKKKKVRDSTFGILALFRKQKPSKILIFNIELTILSVILKKIFRFNTLIYFRSINTLSQVFRFPRTKGEKYFTSKIIRKVLPLCDIIIAQSTGMKQDLISSFTINKNKIITIHNPAVNLSQNNIQHTALNIEGNYFLFVGRLMPQKGLENLIKIFEKALKQKSDLRLLLVGNGPEEKKLKALTNSLGLTTSIKFLGFKQNTSEYYSNAKATVLTSIYEGFPNVLVESIAAGTPVIAFNCPSGPEDIIEPGVNGILVPNQDMTAFTEAIVSVANNEHQFQKQKIIETSRKFSVENTVNQYEEILN